jgi:hypothetical protein
VSVVVQIWWRALVLRRLGECPLADCASLISGGSHSPVNAYGGLLFLGVQFKV